MREGTEEYNKAYMLAKERVDRRRRYVEIKLLD
jgi:hypothetical protein